MVEENADESFDQCRLYGYQLYRMRQDSVFLDVDDYKGKAKVNTQFSFIILTFNEEIHLPRLLASIRSLDAPIFILDSGSTDATIPIAEKSGATVLQHPFENHPKQWDYALKNFA